MSKMKQDVQKFMEERDWLNQPLSDVAKSIIIEAAELLEHFQWEGSFSTDINKDSEFKKEVVSELADVLVYATEMAILLDVDMEKIVHEKLLAASKKYPAGIVNGKLGSKKYKEIKKAYRAKKKPIK